MSATMENFGLLPPIGSRRNKKCSYRKLERPNAGMDFVCLAGREGGRGGEERGGQT